jgi:hypothetical protein
MKDGIKYHTNFREISVTELGQQIYFFAGIYFCLIASYVKT